MKLTVVKPPKIDTGKLNNTVRNSLSHWEYSENQLNKIMDAYSLSSQETIDRDLYLAFHDEQFVGFFSFIKNTKQENELDYFFICKEFIGLGYGRRMWELCCKTAISLNMKNFVILSLPYSAEFYYKMGAKKICSRKSIITEGVFLPILKFSLADYQPSAIIKFTQPPIILSIKTTGKDH